MSSAIYFLKPKIVNKSYRIQNRSSCSKPENTNTVQREQLVLQSNTYMHAKDDFGCIGIKIINISFKIIANRGDTYKI